MANQNLQSSHQTQIGVPAKWQEKFIIKRFDDEDIVVSLREQQAILQALAEGARFVQVRKYTLMVNAIKSIDPYWGSSNIPPKPKQQTDTEIINGVAHTKVLNQGEINLWNKLFSKKVLTNGDNRGNIENI